MSNPESPILWVGKSVPIDKHNVHKDGKEMPQMPCPINNGEVIRTDDNVTGVAHCANYRICNYREQVIIAEQDETIAEVARILGVSPDKVRRYIAIRKQYPYP